jgi:ubiquinone/menaquinone biosynthesis C-methylase UbiE
MSRVQTDFDRIALLSANDSDNSSIYHNFLLKRIPLNCMESLEIGCGKGAFSRLLAARSERVLAIDLSQNMIRAARACSRKFNNIDFQVADVMKMDFPPARFDSIVSIATLHHLPTEEVLSKLKRALKTDGTLIILDLFKAEGLSDLISAALAMPVSAGLKLIRSGRLRAPREVREAWAEHGRSDSYLTMSQVREICGDMLPGAEVRKHLLWRYSVIWKKTVVK